MTADEALREMRLHADNGMTIYANVAQQWADATEFTLKALRTSCEEFSAHFLQSEAELKALREKVDNARYIIANAGGGNWETQSSAWQVAARKWYDAD